MKATHEMLTPGNGGWVRYQSDVLPVPVFARLEEREGRFVIVDLFVPAPEGGGIDTTLLRSVPTARIEAWANSPDARMGASFLLPGPDLRRAVSYFSTSFNYRKGREPAHWVERMFHAQMPGTGEKQPKQAPLAAPMRDPLVLLAAVDATLPVPTGRSYGDDFYRLVAVAYSALAQKMKNPVLTIAEHNDVPLSTVQRWVREARRRGFLGPARPGKRG